MPELVNLLLMSVAGIAAGSLGALLGLGGGIVLVPLLNAGLGLPFGEAAGLSLVGVLATSSSVSVASASRRLLNPRLAIVLLVFSVGGATLAAQWLDAFDERTFELIFGVTAAVVAAVTIARLDKRNVLPMSTIETGALGGTFHDGDSEQQVVYTVRRLPLAAVAAAAAGMLASLVGVGGGILVVPALNSWCGVPIRVAAATSAFMIGITAIPGVAGHWREGDLVNVQLAAVICLGVLVGYRAGLRVSASVDVRFLKMLMAGLLLLVAGKYLFFR